MTTELDDVLRDEMYEQISRELYPEHKSQAIEEFTRERLRSYYVQSPEVMLPAVKMLQEANKLLNIGGCAASTVFSAASYELLLKATLLRPVISGLIHNEGLANVIAERVLGNQTDLQKYKELLSRLFLSLTNVDLGTIKRKGATKDLLSEATAVQQLRNRILHRGDTCTQHDAERALDVGLDIYEFIVAPVLNALDLGCDAVGRIITPK